MEPFALILSAVLAQTSTDASPPPPPPPPPLQHMMRVDTDGDGIVTRQEALTAADLEFARMDADHDGRVTADERRAYVAQARDPRGLGRRGPPRRHGEDQVMTLDQFRARAAARFDRMDGDHDGRLDKTEIANLREARRAWKRDLPPTEAAMPPASVDR